MNVSYVMSVSGAESAHGVIAVLPLRCTFDNKNESSGGGGVFSSP